MRAMETLVDRGLVKYIGVSNFSLAELRAAQAAMTRYPIVSNQVLYNLNRREIEWDLLPYCLQNGITIIAYTPLDDGRLTVLPRFRVNRRMQALALIAGQVGKTLGQVALNWCTSRPNVIAIPKSNRVDRVEENCQASGWRLSPQQVQYLDAAFSQ
jgi:diketogulonate reductase-like aldo/keto reductase